MYLFTLISKANKLAFEAIRFWLVRYTAMCN